jgi:phage terminase large subunit GpA-like protein
MTRRIWGIKGIGGMGKPVWSIKSSRKNLGKIELFRVGRDAAADVVYNRLGKDKHGPGFCHFSYAFDLEFCKQLTAERPTVGHSRGYPTRIWKKIRVRNEGFDLKRYSYAALCGLRQLHRFDLDRECDRLVELMKSASERESDPRTDTADASTGRGRLALKRPNYWRGRGR